MRHDNIKNFMRIFWLFIFLFLLFALNFALIKENRRGMPWHAPTKKIETEKLNKDEKLYPELKIIKEEKNGQKKQITRNYFNRTPKITERKPKIALIIDDFGYSLKAADAFLNLNMPVTFSILPGLAYSSKIAVLANSSGKRVMLHLPMEPYSGTRVEKNMIMSGMTRDEIEKKIEEDLKTVPFAEGVNNHEGSKATEDYNIMKIVLENCKEREMFYVDSITSNSSAAEFAGRNLNMTINRRDIFLDNEDNMDYILGNLEKLKEIAEKNGFAIGIGHARLNTADALKKFYDKNKDKFDFVFAGELYN